MAIEIFIISVTNGPLLDSSLTLCKTQFFIPSGFTTPSFTPNASSEHGTQEISSVKNLEREEGEEGVGRIAMGCQNHLEAQSRPLGSILVQACCLFIHQLSGESFISLILGLCVHSLLKRRWGTWTDSTSKMSSYGEGIMSKGKIP